MKRTIKTLSLSLLVTVTVLTACNDFLDEESFTQFEPKAFLSSATGIEAVLNAAYGDMNGNSYAFCRDYLCVMNEFPADAMFNFGGGFINQAALYSNYGWDSQEGLLETQWEKYYKAINDANSLLDNIHLASGSIPEEDLDSFTSEAKFIRAASYYFLWTLFGSVPLITSALPENLDLNPSRATDEEMDDFITTELKAASKGLPVVQEDFGRATKGAALALLGEYYLNTDQVDSSISYNRMVIALGQYELYQGDIKNQFAVENEGNSSMVFVSPARSDQNPNVYMAHAFPLGYRLADNWHSFASQFTIYNNWFKEMYSPDDKRREWFLIEYEDVDGNIRNLLDEKDPSRGVRCFKYVPGADAISSDMGNDIPYIRYAEVLLNLSEALNEKKGVQQESIDLLNQIRNRAGVNEYNISDFADRKDFRNTLLDERGREFICEGKRRLDLIRAGKLLEVAENRGVTNAKDYMVRYPIPQSEIDINPNLDQNEGYK